MKIQINSLEALERLIGGDSEVEIDIRNSVVQAFATKHLKAVVSHHKIESLCRKTVEGIERDASEKLTKEIGKIKKDGFGNTTGITLSKRVEEVLRFKTDVILSKYLQETVERSIEEWGGEKAIKEEVSRQVKNLTKKKIDDEVKLRLAKLYEKV